MIVDNPQQIRAPVSLCVSDAVALLNQTLEFAYPSISITGELSSFQVSRNKWIYADIKDEQSKLRLFGNVFEVRGVFEDGMHVEVIGAPRLHPQYGLSITVRSMRPVGEGSIKKAANLLEQKLAKEGLFAPERKRIAPRILERIALITSDNSAAYADFIKILNNRWQDVHVAVYDAHMQGDQAVTSISEALERVHASTPEYECVVITRGGGSADDLAAFSDERLVRAIANSRVITCIAIGHEIDVSLCERAADVQGSTPSNLAEILFPDRAEVISSLRSRQLSALRRLEVAIDRKQEESAHLQHELSRAAEAVIEGWSQQLAILGQRLAALDPHAQLRRGYALIINQSGALVRSARGMKSQERLTVMLHDGTVDVYVKQGENT